MKKIDRAAWLRCGVAPVILAAAMLSPSIAIAQDEPQGADDVGAEQIIVVTGSRIARPELESSTPIQVLNSESLLNQGQQNVSDILNELPSVGTPGISRTNSNFATSGNGISTVNLRNLGDQRTLVLMNGRRVVGGLGGTSIVDINNIPTDLLERVEIITGGASAVYGSEAVAGVVNFVLKDNFEGLRLRAQNGITDKGDNNKYILSGTFGANFADNRGNIAVNVQYDEDKGLLSRKRKISANDNPIRSAYAAQGVFYPNDDDVFTYDLNNNLIDTYDQATQGYNRNADRYISVPLKRLLVTSLGHYDVTEGITAFYELSYSRMKSRSALEPYAFDNSDAELPDGTILEGLDPGNPLVPGEIAGVASGPIQFLKRSNGIFDRSNRVTRTFYRAVGGLRGQLAGNWNWDVYFNYSQSKENTSSETALRDRLYYALDAVAGPDGAMCRDAAARAAGCVPLNLFGYNASDAAQNDYVTNGGQMSTYQAKIQQSVIGANINGTAFTLPAGDVKIAAGVERRMEKSSEIYDRETQLGNTLSNALSNTYGRYTVFEAYGEAVVPLIADKPFVEYLGIEGAARYSDYSTLGTLWSYKVGADWAPSSDIRFRGVYSRAVRAPNISELYSGANQTYPSGLVDPCDGVTATSTGTYDNYCRSVPGILEAIAGSPDGVFQSTLADIQHYEGEDRSNPDLQEEKATTYTFGVVLTPQAVRNLSITVDYFDIRVKGAINQFPRQSIIDQCAASNGTDALCDLLVREPLGTPRPNTAGSIYQINTFPVNAGSIKTRGIDVAVNYRTSLDSVGASGNLGIALNYTYLDKLTLEPFPGTPVIDNRGELSGDGRLGAGFKHRGNVSLTYDVNNFTFFWRLNYLSKIKDTKDQSASNLPADVNSIGSYIYNDAQIRFAAGPEKQYEFYFGVDNIFNKKPPVLGQLAASQITGTETAADTYDPIGRAFYAGITAKF
ncbi:MAG: TonB-dependent receptor plug domain-containing protein [Sphingobium sp.]